MEGKAMKKVIDKLMKQYYEMFHDTIPLHWMNLSDQQTIDLITDCLAKHKPFDSSKFFPDDAIL